MLDAARYLQQLQALLPQGQAWSRAPDAMLTRLLAAMADGMARVDARSADLLEELDPSTTLELLGDWERVAGLPDACVPVGGSIADRQTALARKIAGLGGQSVGFFVDLAARLGLDVEIREPEPFDCNSRIDGEISDDGWRAAFIVRVLPPSETIGDTPRVAIAEFTTLSTVDERLASFGAEDLECVVMRAAPAHSSPLFAYPTDPEPMLWFDFTQAPPAPAPVPPEPMLWFDFLGAS
ncbi:DUF2313 domain-containing protein [Sphingomonas naphthae]|uniref:DUF2313 domain-containing protein n=1 Tax=Sphingomonas naphthae TaxID=1813468 RepID=A0ABY7TI87_9SPHN|nr:putative phage tail protein [Sphingomonas naphthae]WCT72044.1 DUF2313 domain-containing protein [Sphingomonas naphthae]